MPYFNIVAETNENTVVTEYEPCARKASAYQTEAELEAEFIRMLCEQGYCYLSIHQEADLIENLRKQLERLNRLSFTDAEWDRFFSSAVANPNEHIVEKTKKVQEDAVSVLRRDDGSSQNVMLLDKKNIHNNTLAVINQYEIGQSEGARYKNRYDVTILVNGLPLVHVELKKRSGRIREAFYQIDRYQRDSFWAGSGLYEYVQIFIISNGTETKYYANTTRQQAIKMNAAGGAKKEKSGSSFEFTSYWADANNTIIPDLVDFTRTFFAKHTLLNILTKYCVFTSEEQLLVMRPYQITATERILNRIEIAENYKKYGTIAAGGYIWHTTGSGKTLTSFKTARLASQLPFIDKVLFVVDRKDLDYQTMREYDRFEKGAANSNTSSAVLERQLRDPDAKIIITTIQKLSVFIKKYKTHEIYNKKVVLIFDECHRGQFGDMHAAIVKNFRRYFIFGFTGTPIFAENARGTGSPRTLTTEQTFGDRLHTYTVIDAINDKNVLPYRVEYVSTMRQAEDIDDEEVTDIDRQKALQSPQRIALITQYILEHFDQKTYRGTQTYTLDALTNVAEVAAGKRGAVEEIKDRQRASGFNAIFATSSVLMAIRYYREFQKQMKENPARQLRIALIYSYAPNDPGQDGLLAEENSDGTGGLDAASRDFLEEAIGDYNRMFHTNYGTDGDRFQSYYKDVSLRMKNKQLDLLIVVNMFLTGFDAPTLNTLFVDKNLWMHGLLQAFSRTNRIFNSVKTCGNIVCFRNLQKQVDAAISLFSDKKSGGVVLMRRFDDYYEGYTDETGREYPGYRQMIEELYDRFPLTEERIVGEQNQKEFVKLFGAVLKQRNILISFDEFAGRELLSQRDLQDYSGRYQNIRDEWLSHPKEKADITSDLVFEVELIRQIEINIDYILLLISQYKSSHYTDKELVVTMQKAIGASPQLRSKKALIEAFIENLNEIDDIPQEWQRFVAEEREKELEQLIKEEHLNRSAARHFMENAFRQGEVKTTGTDIDKVLPPLSLFGGARAAKKQRVIEKLQGFFEKFFDIGGPFYADAPDDSPELLYAAEAPQPYGKREQ